MKKITIETLKQAGASEAQLELFARTFPAGADVTPENC